MSDKLFMSFGAGLVGAFTFWLGIVVLERGLRRFGAQIKLPYKRVFIVLFLVCTPIAFILEGGQKLGFVGGLFLLASIIIWLASLIAGQRQKG